MSRPVTAAGPVRRNPSPSLLDSLMHDHLDPGYAEAAEERALGHARPIRIGTRSWLVVGGVLIGLVLGGAHVQESARAPGTEQVRAEILATVHDARERGDALVRTRDELTAHTARLRSAVLAGDAEGAALLARLRPAELDAGAGAVHGPGLTVTLTDPAARPDLSDATRRTPGSIPEAVLDRDLQAVVNALWAGGAEAVSVGPVRIGPTVTVRQAGGAMLVDNQPVFSPYRVSAVGPPGQLQTRFVVSDAYLRMASVQQLYGVGFSIAESEDLRLPAAAIREVRSAREVGDR